MLYGSSQSIEQTNSTTRPQRQRTWYASTYCSWVLHLETLLLILQRTVCQQGYNLCCKLWFSVHPWIFCGELGAWQKQGDAGYACTTCGNSQTANKRKAKDSARTDLVLFFHCWFHYKVSKSEWWEQSRTVMLHVVLKPNLYPWPVECKKSDKWSRKQVHTKTTAQIAGKLLP